MYRKIYVFLIVSCGYLIFGNVNCILGMNIENQQLCIKRYDVFQYREKDIDEKGVKLESVEQRTFYGAKECDSFGIILESNEQLPPEDFCVKVAQIAARYDLVKPVVPLIDLELEWANVQAHGTRIRFGEKYTLVKEGCSEVDFLLGHELGHRKYSNQEFYAACGRLEMLKNKGFTMLLALPGLCFYNETDRLTFLASFLPMLTHSCIKYFYGQRCHKVELACDEYAVIALNGTKEEKIEVAQMGINYFKGCMEESLLDKIQLYMMQNVLFELPHPSNSVRIKNLQRIIDELNKQKD